MSLFVATLRAALLPISHREPAYKLGYDPGFGDERRCTCGHPYDQHFQDKTPVGCKGRASCRCKVFTLPPVRIPGNVVSVSTARARRPKKD
jgi:hypothetical protein